MRWIGRAVLGVAALHTLFGAVVFRGTVAAMAREGLVATVSDQPDRGAVFWFFYTGFALAMLGGWMNECEAEARRFPTYLVAGLTALTGAGLLIMPASGFWLLVPPVLGAILRNRRVAAGVRR